MNTKQVKLLTQFPVVALVGFLDFRQVIGQVFFTGKGNPVYSLQHRLMLITVPVGTGNTEELKSLYFSGGTHMRSAAQVNKGALSIQTDILI